MINTPRIQLKANLDHVLLDGRTPKSEIYDILWPAFAACPLEEKYYTLPYDQVRGRTYAFNNPIQADDDSLICEVSWVPHEMMEDYIENALPLLASWYKQIYDRPSALPPSRSVIGRKKPQETAI